MKLVWDDDLFDGGVMGIIYDYISSQAKGLIENTVYDAFANTDTAFLTHFEQAILITVWKWLH